MKVTAITRQRRGDRFNVFVDGGFAAGLSEKVLAESGLHEGSELKPGELEKWTDRDEYGLVLSKAYDYLSRRPHSVAEIRGKLCRKEYPRDLIEEAIDHLQDLGYLNDEEFARRWADLRGSTRGKRLVEQELRQKGISPAAVQAAFGDADGDQELADAEALARRRLKRYQGQPWEDVRVKISRYLASRGYSFDTARTVVGRLKTEITSTA